MVRAAALALVVLAAACSGEDNLGRLQKSYDFAAAHGDTDAGCRIAAEAIGLLTQRADNSTHGQILYSTWALRRNECLLDAANAEASHSGDR